MCQVVDTDGPLLLGRETAKLMGYIAYPNIEPPKAQVHVRTLKQQVTDKRAQHKTITKDTSKEKHFPTIKHGTSKIILNDKEHKLPTTKEYLLKEFADVFQGIGTLPGPPYDIVLKDNYVPVQHPPRSCPVGMRDAYKAELDRLVKEKVITEVKDQYTEWVNSIVPVRKPDGSIRLCLDPRDLNKAIERNAWYARTIDDVLPDLADATHITLCDANSGYWQVTLSLRSSLLTTFNTPWGKFRWLRLPFGLKIASDVFQERLDRVIKPLQGTTAIADDIVIRGTSETDHDGKVLTLLETARMNNLTLNPKKIQFKSKDCKFFGHRITPQGLQADHTKIEAITTMTPPKTIQELKSFLGMVNYLSRFSPNLSNLDQPLRKLCKRDVMWTWDSEQQGAFEQIKNIMTTLPVLAYFDQAKDHIIQCDASKKGLGAVLLQENPNTKDRQPVI